MPGQAVNGAAGAETVVRYYYGSWADNPGFQPVEIVAGRDGCRARPEPARSSARRCRNWGSTSTTPRGCLQDVLVGAPGDTISGHGRAGSVTAIGVNEPTPDDDFPFSFTGQYQLLTAPTPATGAAFGCNGIASPQSGLAIGAPGVHGGRVYLYRSSGPGPAAGGLAGDLEAAGGQTGNR